MLNYYSTTTIFSFYFSAWANVEVNMEDRVEVYRGEMAQIACMFTSSDGVGGNVIQWFYVSFIKPGALLHREV